MSAETRIFKGVAEIRGLHDQWEKLHCHPNSDFEHYVLVCQSLPQVMAPLAIGIGDARGWRSIVAGRLERGGIQPRIGYARMVRFPATILTVIYQGVLGSIEAGETADALVDTLDRLLARGEADAVVFSLLPEKHPIWGALEGRSARVLGLSNPAWAVHRTLKLQGEPGFLIRNMRSKHRAWIKRKEKELESACKGQFAWRWVKPEGEVAALAEQMDAIAQATYQRGLGAGFQDNPLQRKRLSLSAGRGQLRVMLLEIDCQPKAFWLGEIQGSTFYSSATGYVPDMRVFEVGTQMFLRMTDELIREGVSQLDFGLGDAHYKERFGDGSWREASVQLFAPTVKGRLLLAYSAACAMSDRFARNVVRKMGVLDSIKQAWRRRLEGARSPAPAARTKDTAGDES